MDMNKTKIREYLEQHPVLGDIIIPLYVFLTYPIKIVRYRAIDPPQYFIFKKHGLVYLVNSKVAQTAITNTCGNKEKKEYSGITETHLGEKVYTLTKEQQQMYAFTFVRNPFDRLVSCYRSKYIADKKKYHKQRLDFDNYMLGYLKKDKGFDTFVKKISKIPDVLADRHFKSQHALIYEQNTIDLDFIGRYEQLNEQFEIIRKKFDLDPLPHLNTSTLKQKDDWKKYYTKDLVDLVAKRYHKDLAQWYPNEEKKIRDFISENESL